MTETQQQKMVMVVRWFSKVKPKFTELNSLAIVPEEVVQSIMQVKLTSKVPHLDQMQHEESLNQLQLMVVVLFIIKVR